MHNESTRPTCGGQPAAGPVTHVVLINNSRTKQIQARVRWTQVIADIGSNEEWAKRTRAAGDALVKAGGVKKMDPDDDDDELRALVKAYGDAKGRQPCLLPSADAPVGTFRTDLDYGQHHSRCYSYDLDDGDLAGLEGDDRRALVTAALAVLEDYPHAVAWGESASCDGWVVIHGPRAATEAGHKHYYEAIKAELPEAVRALIPETGQNELGRLRYIAAGGGRRAHYNPQNSPMRLEPPPEEPAAPAPPRAGRGAGNRGRQSPEAWMEAWPEGLDPLTLVRTQWEGPCPGCLKRTGSGGDDRFHVNAAAPHAFGCRHCLDDKGKPSMEPYWAVFGRGKGKAEAVAMLTALHGGGPFHQVGGLIGAQLRRTWRYMDRARGPYWARYRGGIWEDLTTQDNSLIDWVSAHRLRIAGQLEKQGMADLGKKLAVDYLWNGQKHRGSDLWAGLRSVCVGEVPDRARYHVATPGGCVDLRTGEMHPHSPECGQRGMTVGRYLPVEWPRLSAVLGAHLELVFSPGVQLIFLELVGLSLTGEAATHRGLVLVKGSWRSGKGAIVELTRESLGTRAGALGLDWFGRKSGDIDAETADLLHLQPDSIAVAEMGVDSLSHRRKFLAAFGGQDVLTARRPHGATISGKFRSLGWSSCVEVPRFDAGSGIEGRLVVLPTLGTLPEALRRGHGEMFTQDLLDSVVTGGILRIREAGFFDGGYTPPGGDKDAATAEVLAAMDPWAAWLARLPDSWHSRPVDEAWWEAMADTGEEITETSWGGQINRSPRWTKRRGEVAGVRKMRLYLQGNQGSVEKNVYKEDKKKNQDQTTATLASQPAPEGDEQYHGPLPQLCPKHRTLMVGAFCHGCYREWQDQERSPDPQEEDSPEPSGQAQRGGAPVERCDIHMGYRMREGVCQICDHEDADNDTD